MTKKRSRDEEGDVQKGDVKKTKIEDDNYTPLVVSAIDPAPEDMCITLYKNGNFYDSRRKGFVEFSGLLVGKISNHNFTLYSNLNNITKWVMFLNKKESLSQKSSRQFQESYRTTLQQSTRLYLDLNSIK